MLLKELNYTGVCEVEFLRDPRTQEYKLIEINARTWLWVGLAVACGVNYPVMIYNYLNGNQVDFPSTYQVGLQWMNRLTDLVNAMKSIVTGRLAPWRYLKSLKGRKINAIYDPDDRKPAIMFVILLPYLVLKR